MAIYTHYEVANSPFTSWRQEMSSGNTYVATSSLIVVTNGDGTLTTMHGTFGVANGHVGIGVITSMQRTSADGQTVYESITSLHVDAPSFLSVVPADRWGMLFDGVDQHYGYSGHDALIGGAGKDLLVGGAGDDSLWDRDGEADKLIGGVGDDTYGIDALDTVIEQAGEGFDSLEVYAAGTYYIPDNVEKLVASADNVQGAGNNLKNYFELGGDYGLFYGLGENDLFYVYGKGNKLYGGNNDDFYHDLGAENELHGGTGNDTYDIEDGNDTSIIELEGEGYDTVITDGSEFTLGANLEKLVFNGASTHLGHGNDLDNYIEGDVGQDTFYGYGGNDKLQGFGGGDVLYGGAGDDHYNVFTGDTVIELENDGIDTITTSIATYALGDHIENLKFYGEIAIGNALDNDLEIIGGGEIELHGSGGNDTLRTRYNDALVDGGAGDDTVVLRGDLADWSVLDRGDRIILTNSNYQSTIRVIDAEHLQFDDGTIHFNDGSALFDTIFYMQQNPDVFHAGVNALDHYNAHGRYEGRDPNAWFDTSGYLAANPDVAAAGVNPLEHYHQDGWKEGRDAGPKFDTTRYLLNNPDVAAAGVDPLEHFLHYGMAEGRASFRAVGSNIVNGFDAQYYLFNNADVAAAGIDPLAHFNAYGCKESRDPNAWFDADGYLAHYADVAAAGINPLDHYMAYGWQEGRDASAHFDTNGYLANNPDVAAAHINPLDHYLHYGIYEGRHAVNDGMWS